MPSLQQRLSTLEMARPDAVQQFAQTVFDCVGGVRIEEAIKQGREGIQELLAEAYRRKVDEFGDAAAEAWFRATLRYVSGQTSRQIR